MACKKLYQSALSFSSQRLLSSTKTLAETHSETTIKILKETPKKTSEKSTNETPKMTSKETPKKTSKETPKETTKETLKKTSKETPKETTKETPKETTKETPEKTSKESPMKSPEKTTKETPKKTFKESPMKSPEKTTKETPKRTSKETPKKTSKESPMKSPEKTTKETTKRTSKETPKKTSKETPKKAQETNVASSSTKNKFTFFFKKESPFSQHHACSFAVNGVRYNCAEQFMMHQKALLFNDHENAKEIMKAQSPVVQKRFGRRVKPFDPRLWDSKCESVVKEGNMAKFTQNQFLKKKLFETGGTTLVEASPFDRKWGIGMAESNAAANDRSKWRGKNLLGKILTEVREELLARESMEYLDEWEADDDDDT